MAAPGNSIGVHGYKWPGERSVDSPLEREIFESAFQDAPVRGQPATGRLSHHVGASSGSSMHPGEALMRSVFER